MKYLKKTAGGRREGLIRAVMVTTPTPNLKQDGREDKAVVVKFELGGDF